MDFVKIPVYQLETIERRLEEAIQVCYDADVGVKEYPFASGYSKSAMRHTLDTLKSLK